MMTVTARLTVKGEPDKKAFPFPKGVHQENKSENRQTDGHKAVRLLFLWIRWGRRLNTKEPARPAKMPAAAPMANARSTIFAEH